MSSFEPAPSIIVVSSFVISTRLAVPNISRVTLSNLIPKSSDIKSPLVKIAISSSIAFLLSPKPGALTAAIFKPPLNLLTTNVARASPSTSSAIIKRGLPDWTTFSRTGSIS